MHSATIALALALCSMAATAAQAQSGKCVKGSRIEMTGQVTTRGEHRPGVTLLGTTATAPCRIWSVEAPTPSVPQACQYGRRIIARGTVHTNNDVLYFLVASSVRCE
jgi:hypothetical protein